MIYPLTDIPCSKVTNLKRTHKPSYKGLMEFESVTNFANANCNSFVVTHTGSSCIGIMF